MALWYNTHFEMRMQREFGGAEERTGAKALAESLERAGAEVVFGYPGGNVIDIFDCVRTSKFRFVLGRHEQGCVHMADGYARALGRPGVVLVTSGPGLTNTITGLGAANMDGVPLVLICGQVPLDEMGTDAFQEADTTGLTRAVSKHGFLVKSADEIPETIAQAFYIATHGKPGVVVIDIPRDCQCAQTVAQYPARVSLRAYHPEHFASSAQVNRLARLVNAANRPVIYAGGGVISADAAVDVTALAHKAGIPVVTTMTGIGAIDTEDTLSLGMAGIHGEPTARRALADADLILALGVRFNDRTSATLPRRQWPRIVHVDCDASAIGRNVQAGFGIVADVKDLLATVDSRIRPASRKEWTNRCRPTDRELSDAAKSASVRRGYVAPKAVVDAVCRVAKDNLIAVADVGQHQLWAARFLRHVRPRSFISSGGMGAMGFGIPAAIGAVIARPDAKVVAFVGDGGAQMTAEELAVAAEHKLPVTFIVFSNGTLGLVRQMQKTGFGARYFATDLRSPDFVKLAAAYGIKGVRVDDSDRLDALIRRAMQARGPVLVEVRTDPEAMV